MSTIKHSDTTRAGPWTCEPTRSRPSGSTRATATRPRGQADQLTWIQNQGAKVTLARFDAGLINPEMLQAMEGRVDRFVCRIRPNAPLERLADPLEPGAPFQSQAWSYGEFRYASGTWEREQRVVVKFQTPEGAKGENPLFMEGFYLVTSLAEDPSEVVRFYLQRGEAERVFGDFVQTLKPTFRHVERPRRTKPGRSCWPSPTMFWLI